MRKFMVFVYCPVMVVSTVILGLAAPKYEAIPGLANLALLGICGLVLLVILGIPLALDALRR